MVGARVAYQLCKLTCFVAGFRGGKRNRVALADKLAAGSKDAALDNAEQIADLSAKNTLGNDATSGKDASNFAAASELKEERAGLSAQESESCSKVCFRQ